MPNETPSFELKVDVHIHVLSYVRTRLESREYSIYTGLMDTK
jgi:hypothetical protein